VARVGVIGPGVIAPDSSSDRRWGPRRKMRNHVFLFFSIVLYWTKKIIIGDGQKSAPAGVQDWT
jgi:hypothetical protein